MQTNSPSRISKLTLSRAVMPLNLLVMFIARRVVIDLPLFRFRLALVTGGPFLQQTVAVLGGPAQVVLLHELRERVF